MIPPCLRVCPNVILVRSGHAARTCVSWVVFAQIIIKTQLRGTARGWHANHILFLCFFRLAVQISGSVEDYPVPAITVDTATDVSVVSSA